MRNVVTSLLLSFSHNFPSCFPHCRSVTCGLSPPTIVSNTMDEVILQPGSDFNISCTGERAVTWDGPLPENTVVEQENFMSTLIIFNATVENVGDYTCMYETQEDEPDSEEENEAGIYVFVPGEYVSYF